MYVCMYIFEVLHTTQGRYSMYVGTVCEQLSTSGGGGTELTTVEQERRLKRNCL